MGRAALTWNALRAESGESNLTWRNGPASAILIAADFSRGDLCPAHFENPSRRCLPFLLPRRPRGNCCLRKRDPPPARRKSERSTRLLLNRSTIQLLPEF